MTNFLIEKIINDTDFTILPINNPLSNCYNCKDLTWKCSYDLCQGDQWKLKFNVENFKEKYKKDSFRTKLKSITFFESI